eukprot:scaffold14367_cov250-Ochromonas_danica.AAC.8
MIRLVHVKMIGDVAQSIGFQQTVATIVPLLDALAKDGEPVVKQHLVEQLKHLAKFFYSEGGEQGYKVMLEKLLPLAASLLEDEKQEVRQSASMTIVEIAQMVRLEDIGQHVLTVILRLAHEDDKEDMRMTAAQLLNLLAEPMGYDLCRQFVIPEVVSLAEDPVFRVRKSTALNFHSICKVGGEHELLERLMPAFVRLSKDDMYRVRRACAESLSEISKNVSEDIRLGVLVEIFLRLAHDPSRLVKQSILQQSGMFIATLPSRAVNETILGQYISMASNPTGDATGDGELRHICAYSFPAVLQVIGRERWTEVRELYHNLAQSRSTNIKQTLACSLHEVARILEDETLIEEELVPVFEDMFQCVEVVQIGVIKHIAAFLGTLPDLCRVSFLPILHEMLHSTNPFNWRLRQYLAVQLPDLVALPAKPDVFHTLYPTIMTLLQDPVASVRCDTFQGVTAMVKALLDVVTDECSQYDEETKENCRQNLDEIVNSINAFITSDKFQMRQLWMELCPQLLRDLPRDFFEKNFIHGVLILTLDRVFNVRLAVSNFLVGWSPDHLSPWDHHYQSDHAHESVAASVVHSRRSSLDLHGIESPWRWLLTRSDIKQCVERLSKDDRDICNNVSLLKSLYPDISFVQVSCRGRRIAPGGNEPISLDPTPINTVDESSFLGLEESAQILEAAVVERLRSTSISSARGRSTTIELDDNITMCHIPKIMVNNSEEDEDGCPAPLSSPDRESFTLTEAEREYTVSMLDPTVVDELDIIDGLKKSPFVPRSKDASSFTAARPSFTREDSDEYEQEMNHNNGVSGSPADSTPASPPRESEPEVEEESHQLTHQE